MRKWAYLKFFNEKEAWGNADAMDPDLLFLLDEFREKLGEKVRILQGTQGIHSTNSQHYLGKAVDIILPEQKTHPLDVYLLAEKLGFTGIGIYVGWKLDGNPIVGYHLDDRSGNQARWIGIKKQNGDTDYRALSYENLKELNLI